MTVPVVRAIEDADIPGAVAALVEVHATDGYPVEGVARPREWITSSAVVQAWVAEVDRRIVGHVAVMRPQGEDAVALWCTQSSDDERRIGVLARLYVVREARGRAAGESLMRAAMAYARQRELRLVLDVMAKDTGASASTNASAGSRSARRPTATETATRRPRSATSHQPADPVRTPGHIGTLVARAVAA